MNNGCGSLTTFSDNPSDHTHILCHLNCINVISNLLAERDWCATFAVKQTTCLYRFSVKRICFGRYFLSFSVYFVQLSLSQCSEQTEFTTSLVTRHRSQTQPPLKRKVLYAFVVCEKPYLSPAACLVTGYDKC